MYKEVQREATIHLPTVSRGPVPHPLTTGVLLQQGAVRHIVVRAPVQQAGVAVHTAAPVVVAALTVVPAAVRAEAAVLTAVRAAVQAVAVVRTAVPAVHPAGVAVLTVARAAQVAGQVVPIAGVVQDLRAVQDPRAVQDLRAAVRQVHPVLQVRDDNPFSGQVS